jgi:hypothetical protein
MRKFLAGGLLLLFACSGLTSSPASPVLPPAWDWAPTKGGMAASDPVKLVRDFPDSSAARLRLLNSQVQAGDQQGVLQSLAWLNGHGHQFSPASRKRLRDLVEGWALPVPALAEQVPVISASRELATVPAPAQLVESVAYDRKRGRLFVSTVVSRQLWLRAGKGEWRQLPLAGVDSLSGMVIDREQDLLWLSSANLDMGTGPNGAFHGLIALDLATLKEKRRIAAPAGVNPSDIALGCNGTLYASDPLGGGVYRAAAGDTELAPLIAPGTFRSPQGLATSAGCTVLYVSDYGYGLAAIVLDTKRVLRVSATAELPIPLDGIDGLWRVGNDLIAVQNGTSPRRIVRLSIGYGGTSIFRAAILEQANPDWTEPLSGSLDGKRLVYVATGQWDRFDKGQPLSANPPGVTQLRALPLGKTNH